MANTVYIIAGPTAVGKTAVSIALAQRMGTAVISADSRQCYKEMTIGTAKPSAAELEAVKHYFIDEFSVVNHITAAYFEELSLGYLTQVFEQRSTAVVCGGTGLYIKALCEGLDEMPPVNADIARDVQTQYEAHGIAWLQQTIKEEDEQFYTSGEIQNPARLLRALAFIRSTGESISNFKTGIKKQRPFNIIKIGLELPRDVLYARIDKRVDDMMANGLLDEVKGLYALRKLKNLHTVGYTELFNYIDNSSTLPEAVEKIKQHTRNYAKRQMTWFRKDKEMQWFSADDKDIVEKILAL